jgi:hypothetical protein
MSDTVAHNPEATYELVPSDWPGTVREHTDSGTVFHHPCHLDCPAIGRVCMTCRVVWPCEVAVRRYAAEA